jgi:hypothetical protein
VRRCLPRPPRASTYPRRTDHYFIFYLLVGGWDLMLVTDPQAHCHASLTRALGAFTLTGTLSTVATTARRFRSKSHGALAERFIRTMKEELVWLQDWESADELRVAIARWLDGYNHRRPHQALGWLTPAEYRASRLAHAA